MVLLIERVDHPFDALQIFYGLPGGLLLALGVVVFPKDLIMLHSIDISFSKNPLHLIRSGVLVVTLLLLYLFRIVNIEIHLVFFSRLKSAHHTLMNILPLLYLAY
jgi:hypothetical protein